jgi:hypothetical protein
MIACGQLLHNHYQQCYDTIAVIGPVLLRWADARHRTVYQDIGGEAPVDDQWRSDGSGNYSAFMK